MSQRCRSLGGDEGTFLKVPSSGVLGGEKPPKRERETSLSNKEKQHPDSPHDWGEKRGVESTTYYDPLVI